MNNDKEFKLLIYLMFATVVAILLTCSWESYLHYLNRKLVIEAIKKDNVVLSVDQIQGLINSKQ